ncbi:hypothetical protein [Phenylobacterium sp.]|uniref:hypothetical protein n=1 Tax=Phenylobacterium sp. TaxID=1871053 RepID=UPI0025E329B0|nr:hypothetical protein [Phenylobacterium sp.]MCA6262709.1 hypothetical protein [Phenylobacterium sp.]MCA6301670.1 hypothetical protein [Phenylobacterium sp.]MCA6317828.1 hypothetical protein [Phenylobacterium sp.]
MLYQRKILPNTNVNDPGPLPPELVGLADESLANLSAALGVAAEELGYAGQGFFPYTPPPPPPEPITKVNKVDFLRLFTQAERIAIRAAARENDLIADYQAMLDAADIIYLTDPDIQTGVPLLELGGLIGPGRAAQILAGESP